MYVCQFLVSVQPFYPGAPPLYPNLMGWPSLSTKKCVPYPSLSSRCPVSPHFKPNLLVPFSLPFHSLFSRLHLTTIKCML